MDNDDSDDHNLFIASLLFPNENVSYTPDGNALNGERQRLAEVLMPSEYRCEKCGKISSRLFNHRRHVKTCKKGEGEKCKKTLSKPHNYKRHTETCLGGGGKKHECEKCKKTFSNPHNYKRHTETCLGGGKKKHECEKCKKTFSTVYTLNRHAATCKDSVEFSCGVCGMKVKSSRLLQRHVNARHTNKCPICRKQFDTKINLARHAKKHLNEDFLTIAQARHLRKLVGSSRVVPLSKTLASTHSEPTPSGSGSAPIHAVQDQQSSNPSSPDSPTRGFEQTTKRIHGDAGAVLTMRPSGVEKHSMLEMFSGKRAQFRHNLSGYLKRWNNTRWYLSVTARMMRFDSEGNIRDEDRPTFCSKAQILLEAEEIGDQIDLAYFKINASLETFCSSASGWVLDEILTVVQTILMYRPLGGNCGDFTFPTDLYNRGLVSVTGRPSHSRDCFLWAVIAAIHRDPDGDDAYVHWTELREQRKLYTLTKPMSENATVTTSQIPEFETLNDVSVNVFAIEDSVFPLYISKNTGKRGHANLLLVHTEKEGNADDVDDDDDGGVFRHYCAVMDLGRLIKRQVQGGSKVYVCPRCLCAKYSVLDLQKHTELCSNLEPLAVTMPTHEHRFLRFRNYHLQLEAPFVIVARFESFRMPIYDRNEATEGATVRERVHRPCASSYYRMSVDDSHPSEPVTFADPDPEKVMTEFLRQMKCEQDHALAIMKGVRPMEYCDEGLRNLQASNEECHICGDTFVPGQKVVTDHDHVSGKIRGRACNGCNLNFRCPDHIIVLLHDLSAYDGRIVMSAAALQGASKITVIPKTTDTYVGITVDKCRYIDFQNFFKGSSLDTLIEDLYTEAGIDAFPNTRAHWPSFALPVPLRRVPLCRDYIDGPERLTERILPGIAAFHDRVQGTDLPSDQYETAENVWNFLDDPSLLEYMKCALVTDCLYTSDIVSHFRKTVREHLKLDPLRYYTLASFAFDSALRFSGTSLELPTDIEMHLMVENAIRGGLAVVGTPRFSMANHPDMPADVYDPLKESKTLEFLDFNGLYTSIMMSDRLPTYGFRWLSRMETETIDFLAVPKDSDQGFILEVDLEYPESVHEKHDDFPMAPEHMYVRPEDLSDYSRETARSCGVNLENMSNLKRLCLTLRDKQKYTLHYRALQFYVSQGLRVTEVHRVLRFVQIPFLRSFMTYCAEQRTLAKSKLYKGVWKNISNLVCGKCYENPRNYSVVKICTSSRSLRKYVAKPTFKSVQVFSENLSAVQLHRPVVKLARPISVGFAILELSKLSVYSFYYDFLKKELARGGKCKFLAGDTDSLIIEITGISNLQERYRNAEHLFDFSNLPASHPLKSNLNRMVPGKVKFELPGHVCCEFVALSPKCYSMNTDQGFKQARKACSRELRHELYRNCLLSSSCHAENVKEVRNYGQDLYQVSVTKRVLNVLDVKRHHLNATESVSFGHFSLK